MNFPYGACECREGCGTCRVSPGPAAFEVVRADGRVAKVCTRCDLSNDKSRKLLATTEDDCDVYREWDARGLFVILGMLAGDIPIERTVPEILGLVRP